MTNITIDQKVKIIDVMGVIHDGYTIAEDDRNRSGSIVVKDNSGKLFKVYPDRVVSNTDAASIAVLDESISPCPVCKKIVRIVGENVAECDDHGRFNVLVDNSKIKQTIKKKPTSRKPISKFVDFHKLSEISELWVKGNINFDHERVEVQSCMMIFPDAGRYITFNTYNGSYGRKGTLPHEDVANGSGYKFSDIESIRSRFRNKGYTKYGSPVVEHLRSVPKIDILDGFLVDNDYAALVKIGPDENIILCCLVGPDKYYTFNIYKSTKLDDIRNLINSGNIGYKMTDVDAIIDKYLSREYVRYGDA